MTRAGLRARAEAALCEATGASRVVRLCPRCGSSEHGRPRLVGSPLSVSISYAGPASSPGLALVAWGAGPLGIDVELAGPPVDGVGERLAWTRTEALLKATGLGVDATGLPRLATYALDVPGHVATLAGEGQWSMVTWAEGHSCAPLPTSPS